MEYEELMLNAVRNFWTLALASCFADKFLRKFLTQTYIMAINNNKNYDANSPIYIQEPKP